MLFRPTGEFCVLRRPLKDLGAIASAVFPSASFSTCSGGFCNPAMLSCVRRAIAFTVPWTGSLASHSWPKSLTDWSESSKLFHSANPYVVIAPAKPMPVTSCCTEEAPILS